MCGWGGRSNLAYLARKVIELGDVQLLFKSQRLKCIISIQLHLSEMGATLICGLLISQLSNRFLVKYNYLLNISR